MLLIPFAGVRGVPVLQEELSGENRSSASRVKQMMSRSEARRLPDATGVRGRVSEERRTDRRTSTCPYGNAENVSLLGYSAEDRPYDGGSTHV